MSTIRVWSGAPAGLREVFAIVILSSAIEGTFCRPSRRLRPGRTIGKNRVGTGAGQA